MQIDQNSTTAINAKLGKDLTEGKFYVLLGGDGNLYTSAMYEIKGDDTPELIFVGDADGSGKITAQDASEIAKKVANKTSKIDDNENNWYAAAYSDGNAKITAQDASEVAKKVANKTVKYVGQSVNKGFLGAKSTETVTE